jgi:hypothetical protein
MEESTFLTRSGRYCASTLNNQTLYLSSRAAERFGRFEPLHRTVPEDEVAASSQTVIPGSRLLPRR